MTYSTKVRLYGWFLVIALGTMLVAIGTSSCSVFKGGGSPVEGRVLLLGHDPNTRPTTYVSWDGDLLVWWADAQGVAELRGKTSKLPIATDTFEANKAGAKLKSKKLEWKGAAGQPMPSWVSAAFTEAEIAAWSLTFQEVAP